MDMIILLFSLVVINMGKKGCQKFLSMCYNLSFNLSHSGMMTHMITPPPPHTQSAYVLDSWLNECINKYNLLHNVCVGKLKLYYLF